MAIPEWIAILCALIVVFGSLLTGIAGWVALSIGTLNVNVATVIEKINSHERRLGRLEERA